MEWYLKVWRNYANFNGRARRKEYWMFTLLHYFVILCIYAIIFTTIDSDTSSLVPVGFGLVAVYWLSALIPTLAVIVRRLHDIDKSGWMILVYFIPFVGPIWLLVMLLTDGTPGPNQYGGNPKEFGGGQNVSDHLVEV
ncbi:MAG: uncharacterized membrane protein YhaH (DUF805 family) [Bacteroidia bacterium]|jgi:uncharacterized membrane protein YhaH (DUF805 family)